MPLSKEENSDVPKIQTNFKYFRGQEGVRKVWRETLNVKNKELLWTTANEATINLVGKRFTENYILEAKKRGIKTKILRNFRQKGRHRFFQSIKKMNCEPRELSKEMNLKNALVIFDNKVASFSPIEENYGFQIESKSFADTMRALYMGLWSLAKPFE